MSIRVIAEIEEDNKWRENDFAQFKMRGTGENYDPLWGRMCLLMLYAHWEGFVVSALKILISHINSLEIESERVSHNLMVLCLSDQMKALNGKQSFDQKMRFFSNFSKAISQPLKLEKKIDTKSNLRKEVLEEICIKFSFDFNRFKELTYDLDRLVNIRNAIAHGENSVVLTFENLNKYIDLVRGLIDIFKEEISEFLERKKFHAV